MSHKCRLASYVPKGKGKQAMKQQKAMLIALIVICLTVIVTALVTRKDLCEERPLLGTTPNRPDGGRCLHSLRT